MNASLATPILIIVNDSQMCYSHFAVQFSDHLTGYFQKTTTGILLGLSSMFYYMYNVYTRSPWNLCGSISSQMWIHYFVTIRRVLCLDAQRELSVISLHC